MPHGLRHDSRWAHCGNWITSLVAVGLCCNLVRGYDGKQFAVQSAVGGEDLPIGGTKLATAHVGDRSSGLCDDYGAGGDIPG